jgi:hypothetical protein
MRLRLAPHDMGGPSVRYDIKPTIDEVTAAPTGRWAVVDIQNGGAIVSHHSHRLEALSVAKRLEVAQYDPRRYS